MSFLFALVLALSACSEVPDQKPVAKTDSTSSKKPTMTVSQVLDKYTDEWMKIPGVIGTGEGMKDGKPSVVVFVEEKSDAIEKKIPKTIEGHPVDITATGTIEALEQ